MAGNPIQDLLTLQQQIDTLKARVTALEQSIAAEQIVVAERRANYARTIQEIKTRLSGMNRG